MEYSARQTRNSIMSVESRSPLRVLRGRKKDDERPDYSEPDFSGWSAKLDDFIPAAKGTPAKAVATESAAPVAAPAAAVAVEPAPAVEAVDSRPSLENVLETLLGFDGALCVAVVDSDSGMILGKAGSGVEMDLAAANASVILRARLASTKALGTKEKIDDMLISLSSQVQIIHPLPSNPSIFTYLIGDKSKSSLAMARFKATEADQLIRL
jgi:predicted regulator of Ras-like GTPase activity (Roadblock/LC7/MglB family)